MKRARGPSVTLVFYSQLRRENTQDVIFFIVQQV